MSQPFRVLAINPGSTSTKIACFDGTACIMERTLRHAAADLSAFASINDQRTMRRRAVLEALDEAEIAPTSLSAVVGRGGLLHPLTGGTYQVNHQMLVDLETGVQGAHASNLGGILADEIARSGDGCFSFIVDPVVVDELADEARYSGIPGLPRTSIFHALNQKAVARRYAAEQGRSYGELSLVVAHLGGGITVGTHRHGRVVEVNDGLNGEGPFSPERSGGVAALKLVDQCFAPTADQAAIRRSIKGAGGLMGYLGTTDAREISERIRKGDQEAEAVYRAMAWQIVREIGASAAVLGSAPEAILLTGGLAYDDLLVGWITEKVAWLGPVHRYPGEDEMTALAEGALRVLEGREDALEYRGAHR